MKKLYVIYFLLLSYAFTFAQTSSDLSIKGVVKDKNDKPLSNVALELLNENNPTSSLYEVSDEFGKFEFQHISPSKYKLTVSGTEYDFAGQTIEVSDQSVVLQPIVLSAVKQNDLAAVEVVARKKPTIEVKPDMMVFNVQNSPTSTGLSGLDLLRKSPGVSVDKDNNILLKGNPGTRVFINGKPSYMDGKQLADWLQSVRSEDIEKIEIISSPSAKYEAEGTGGIINFVMKKGKAGQNNGFNGSVTADLGLVLQNEKYQGSYNLSLTYRKDKLTLGGSYGFSNGTEYWRVSSNRTQDRYYREFETGGDTYNNHNGTLNFDYEFNPKHSLSVNLRINSSSGTSPLTSQSDIDTLSNYKFDELLSANRMGDWTNRQIVPSITYVYKDSAFGELAVTTDYSSIKNTGLNRIENRYYADEKATINKSTNIFDQNFSSIFDISATKVDWNKTWDNLKLEAGMKHSYTHADNTQKQSTVASATGIATLDPSKSSRFIYQENILAAYLQAQYTLKKFSFLLGLRDEYTATTGTLMDIQTDAVTNETDRQYNGLFPTVNVGFKPSDKHAFSVQYSRRLRRPYYANLNPFETQESELSYEKGNPNLLPEYNNKIEFNYTLMGMINLSVSYSANTGVMVQNFDSSGKISYRQMENLGERNIWGVSLSTPLFIPKVDWFSGFANLNFNYTTNQGTINGQSLSLSFPGFNGYVEANFRLPAKFSAGFSTWFVTSSVWSASIEHQAFGSLDLSIQKKLFKDKLNVKLYMQDVLKTANIHFYNHAIGVRLDDGWARWGSQRVGINLSYSFGKNDNKIKARGKQDDDDRLKSGGGGIRAN